MSVSNVGMISVGLYSGPIVQTVRRNCSLRSPTSMNTLHRPSFPANAWQAKAHGHVIAYTNQHWQSTKSSTDTTPGSHLAALEDVTSSIHSVTSLVLADVNVKQAYDALEELFKSEFHVLCLKVNRVKNTLKAEVLNHDRATCVVKVRLNDADGRSDGCVAELQRYAGDCIAFNEVFRRVQQFLCNRFDLATGGTPPKRPAEKDAQQLDHAYRCNATVVRQSVINSTESPAFLRGVKGCEPQLSRCPEFFSVDLSATSFVITDTRASEMLDAIHAFLTTQVVTMSQTIKLAKNSVKAEILTTGDTPCIVKVRICEWTSIPNTCTVEVRRYAGDSVAFNTIFRAANQFLGEYAAGLVTRDVRV